MASVKVTSTLILLTAIVTFSALVSANVYYNGVAMFAPPIYFGGCDLPFITFGNITGLLTVGNATNAKGNIVLCPTLYPPIEKTLYQCIQNQPAALITVTPVTMPQGKIMYNPGISCYNINDTLRQTHIVELNPDNFTTLVLAYAANDSISITVDGSTQNIWVTINDGPWGIWHQITESIPSFLVVVFCCWQVWTWRGRTDVYADGTTAKVKTQLGYNTKTFITILNIIGCTWRGFYAAIGPQGLRRIITQQDDLINTTFVLWEPLTTSIICALFYLEMTVVINFRIKTPTFLSNKWTWGIVIGQNFIWLIMLIVWRVSAEFPNVSPIANGKSLESLILIQIILIGICMFLYAGIAIAVIVAVRRQFAKAASRGSRQRDLNSKWRAFYLGLTSFCLAVLFGVTVTAFTPAWGIPWVPQVLVWLCYFITGHPMISFLQQLSFTTVSSGTNSSKTAHTTSGRSSSISRHTLSSNSGDPTPRPNINDTDDTNDNDNDTSDDDDEDELEGDVEVVVGTK